MDHLTPAEVLMGLGGKTFNLVGLGFVAIAGLYAVNRITTSAIKVVESIPYWLTMKQLKEGEKNEALITKEDVPKAARSYGAIILVLIVGTGLGVFGRYVSAPSVIKSANTFLYRLE